MQRLAHAIETLELVRTIAGKHGDGGNGMGVVRGELRKERFGPREQRPRRGQISDVGIDLAGKHRIAGEPPLLRPFDLAVPIGALDQPHRNASARLRGNGAKPLDQRQRPLAIGLHREAKSVPASKRGIGEQRLDQSEAKLELILLLGIDGERQPGVAHGNGQISQHGEKLLPQWPLLRRLVARVQRRQLDRKTRPSLQLLVAAMERRSGPSVDGLDRLPIARGIAPSVFGRARGLAQHVEGEAIAQFRLVLSVVKRLADGLTEHELAAQNAHRLAQRLADHGLAAGRDQPLDHGAEIGAIALAPIDHAPGQHQAIGRGIDQKRAGMAEMLRPVAAADGAGDQAVGGGAVGDAEQRLGQAEQQDPFPARKTIFVQEGIDAAGLTPPFPRRPHQSRGQGFDLALLFSAHARLFDQRRDKAVLVREQCLAQPLSVRRRQRGSDLQFRLTHEVNVVLHTLFDPSHSSGGRNPVSSGQRT